MLKRLEPKQGLFSYVHFLISGGYFTVQGLVSYVNFLTPWLQKKAIFGEVFAEGSLPERHSLVLEKRLIFCSVFAEGSPPERHSEVLKYGLFYETETFVFWHIAEISAQKWVENDRTDVVHLFIFIKTHVFRSTDT